MLWRSCRLLALQRFLSVTMWFRLNSPDDRLFNCEERLLHLWSLGVPSVLGEPVSGSGTTEPSLHVVHAPSAEAGYPRRSASRLTGSRSASSPTTPSAPAFPRRIELGQFRPQPIRLRLQRACPLRIAVDLRVGELLLELAQGRLLLNATSSTSSEVLENSARKTWPTLAD